MRKINLRIIATFLMIITSFMISILLLVCEKPNNYIYIPILPFVFCIIMTFSATICDYLFKSIVYTSFIAIFYVKLVIIPFLLMIEKFPSIGSIVQVQEKIPLGIILMIYEFITISFTMIYSLKKNKFNYIYNMYLDKKINFTKLNKKSKIAIVFLCSVVIFILIIYPSLIEHLNFMNYKASESYDRHGANGAIFAIFDYIVNLLFFILPFLIFQSLVQLKNKRIAYILNIILLALPFAFNLPNRWYSVGLSITLTILTMKFYKKNKIMNSLFLIIIPIVTLFLLNQKVSNLNYVITANMYFPGVESNACVFVMPSNNKYLLFLGDILRSIPFLAGFFTNMEVSTHLFSSTLFGYDRLDQIFPFISQGYYFFGILAPVLGMIITIIVCKWEINYIKSSNCFIKLSYIWLIIWTTYMLLIGNINGYITGIFQFIIPFIFIISKNKVLINKSINTFEDIIKN